MARHPNARVAFHEPVCARNLAIGSSQVESRRVVYEQRLQKMHARLKDGRTQIGLGYDDYSPQELREAAFEHACWIYHDTVATDDAMRLHGQVIPSEPACIPHRQHDER